MDRAEGNSATGHGLHKFIVHGPLLSPFHPPPPSHFIRHYRRYAPPYRSSKPTTPNYTYLKPKNSFTDMFTINEGDFEMRPGHTTYCGPVGVNDVGMRPGHTVHRDRKYHSYVTKHNLQQLPNNHHSNASETSFEAEPGSLDHTIPYNPPPTPRWYKRAARKAAKLTKSAFRKVCHKRRGKEIPSPEQREPNPSPQAEQSPYPSTDTDASSTASSSSLYRPAEPAPTRQYIAYSPPQRLLEPSELARRLSESEWVQDYRHRNRWPDCSKPMWERDSKGVPVYVGPHYRCWCPLRRR